MKQYVDNAICVNFWDPDIMRILKSCHCQERSSGSISKNNIRKILSLTTEQTNQPKPGMMSQEGYSHHIRKRTSSTAMEKRYNFRTT